MVKKVNVFELKKKAKPIIQKPKYEMFKLNREKYKGSHIRSKIGDEYASNKSYENYYKDLI